MESFDKEQFNSNIRELEDLVDLLQLIEYDKYEKAIYVQKVNQLTNIRDNLLDQIDLIFDVSNEDDLYARFQESQILSQIPENKSYEITFNLDLVRNGLRLAYLFETANFPEVNPEVLFNEMKRVYPEYKFTVEYKIKNKVHRFYVHMKPLYRGSSDQAVAKNLGFQCLGIPDENRERIGIHYNLIHNNKKTGLYAEICEVDNFNRDFYEIRQDEWNKLANKYGWNIELELESLMPSSSEMDEFLNAVINNKIDNELKERILDKLGGDGIIYIEDNIDEGNYTWRDVIRNKRHLIFALLRSDITPFSPLYPFTNEEFEQISQIEKELFSNLNNDPVKIHRKLTNEVLNLLKADIYMEEDVISSNEELYNAYYNFFP